MDINCHFITALDPSHALDPSRSIKKASRSIKKAGVATAAQQRGKVPSRLLLLILILLLLQPLIQQINTPTLTASATP